MKKILFGFITGIAATLVGGFIMCEVAEHCDLPMEVPK